MNPTTSRAALLAGAITAAYFTLSSLFFFFNIQFPWTLPLMPGIAMLLAPAELLAPFGLAEHNWLIGTWPTDAGVIVLIALYSALACGGGALSVRLRTESLKQDLEAE
jgi:hypothetical protein